MKTIATSLLLVALAGLALSHAMGSTGSWAWVRAFCEASAIGAVADWFAVVALFRHPLGLKIPHTAIIPQGKARLADGLAEFVRDHFLEPQALLAKLALLDPALKLGHWLSAPERRSFWVAQARGWALEVLDNYDDARFQKATALFITERAQRWDAAPTVGSVLGLLSEQGRHHELLDAGLQKLSEFLQEDEVKAKVSALMVKHARKEWPKVIGALELVTKVSDMADSLAEKLGASLLSELRDVLAQPEHPVRQRYEDWLKGFTQRLSTDPALVATVNQLKERALADPAVQRLVAELWIEAKHWLRDDLMREDSGIARQLEVGLHVLGRKLIKNKRLRESLNAQVLAMAAPLVANLRTGMTAHIAQTVKAWDNEALVQTLERHVGRDLQFIRINGTLVGGLIGLLLHALSALRF